MKIQIIGYSGSGKSTLAKSLANHYQLPLLYLDNTKFYQDWQERTNDEQNEIVKKFLDANPNGWVIDGNYSKIAPERFTMCDQIIFLNYNRFFCFFQALKRYRKNKNKSRESCPCIEKFDLEFQKWILFSGRSEEHRQKHIENFQKCKGEKLVFKTRKALLRYLQKHNIDYIFK